MNDQALRLAAARTWVATLLVLTASVAAAAQPVPEVKENGAEMALNLRLRFEGVSDDAVGDKDAEALTLRTSLLYRTARWRGLTAFVEAESISVADNETFNNRGAEHLGNGVTDRPVIADPELTELNQSYLEWEKAKTRLRVGRQEILLGDQRFVGNVGWRQNHQSFDGVSLSAALSPRVALEYAYIDRVNRIFGDRKKMSTHALRVVFSPADAVHLTAYGYLLDFDLVADAALSTSTYGVELKGGTGRDSTARFIYELEYAQQSDAGDNPGEIEASYYNAALGGDFGGFSVKVGTEVLEGGTGGKFTTPLATLHKFDGWADKFLATPTDGIEDLSLSIGSKVGGFRWSAVYHDFRANEGSESYGTELDLSAVYRTRWNQTFGLKVASYDADTFAADTDKVIIWTAHSF